MAMTDREQAIARGIQTLNALLDDQLRKFISSVTVRCADMDQDDLDALIEEAREQCETTRTEFSALIEQTYRDM